MKIAVFKEAKPYVAWYRMVLDLSSLLLKYNILGIQGRLNLHNVQQGRQRATNTKTAP